ncbi:unnamed protein product [Auanema sp. JU1783]|nr:unnamed protein product [Auanema sp. JU1783]
MDVKPSKENDKDSAQPLTAVFRVEGTAATSKPKKPVTTGGTQEDIMIETLSAENASTYQASDCVAALRSDAEAGLSTAEATRRRQFHGYNEFDVAEQESVCSKYLEQFKNPLILLLLGSAVVSLLMRQFDDAISITIAVVIVVTVGFVQEYRSEKTLEQLNKLVPPACNVVRDGREHNMLARELVPGDIIVLNTGDRVPADLRLIEAHSMAIDESSFTGETEPKHKEAAPVSMRQDVNVENMINIAFMGTLVRNGRGKGIVTSTAASSQFGAIFKLVQEEESPKTPLQKSMDMLGKQLSMYSFGVIGGIFVIGLIQGRNVLDMFNIGVSLAVAAIPEGLPIVVAVTLAIGVMRMATRRAVIKKMPAVETLGCVTVICSDKTGTLTKNEMTATCVVTPEGRKAEVTGLGYSTEGSCTYNGNIVMGYNFQEIASIIEVGSVCNNSRLIGETVIGQPTEGALVVLAKKTGLDGCSDNYERVREIPFSHESKWMAVQCVNNGHTIFFVKGALDCVMDLCDSYRSSDGSRKALDGYVRQRILDGARGLASTGLRVLGMARGGNMQSLQLEGMVGMMDPPRPGATEAIATVKSSGVDVKLITGDAQETAMSIGAMLGVYRPTDSCLSGTQIDSMSDPDLELVIRQVSIIYRATPRHKLKIVKALQSVGEIVAMTGDGVNDAAALKTADIGVAMGLGGTDVCKEAADMILCDDDFTTMTSAIEEGKAIYHNITNFVRFQLSTSVAALSLIAASTLFHFENPLNAMQILWINILMDGPPAQSLGVEPVDDDIIRLPPRNVKQSMLTRKLITHILCSATIIVSTTLFIYYKEMSADNKITPRDTTMTFTCFVMFGMWNALSCRSSRKLIWELGLFRNKMFCLAIGGSLIGQLLVIYWAPLQNVFQTEALSLFDLLFLASLTSTVFIFNETRKYIELRSNMSDKKGIDIL